MSFLSGMGGALIAYTAWPILVPLLFGSFGLDFWSAIFVSMAVDLYIGLMVGAVGAARRSAWIHVALIVGMPAACVALLVSFLTRDFVTSQQDNLRSSVAVTMFVLGVFFLLRSARQWYKAHKAKQEAETKETEEATVEMSEVTVQVDSDNTKEGEEEERSWKESLIPMSSLRLSKLKWGLLTLLSVIGGILTGTLGFGGGANYAMGVMIVYKADVRLSTMTGCLMMGVSLLPLTMVTITFVEWRSTWPFLLTALIASTPGVILGLVFSKKFSLALLNCAIGMLLIGVGIMVTIQGAFFT